MYRLPCPLCGATLESEIPLQLNQVIRLGPHYGGLCGGPYVRVVQAENTGELKLIVLDKTVPTNFC